MHLERGQCGAVEGRLQDGGIATSLLDGLLNVIAAGSMRNTGSGLGAKETK